MDAHMGWLHSLHEWALSFVDENGINILKIKNVKEMTEFFAKIFATALVMVYNFISRKMTLEKK